MEQRELIRHRVVDDREPWTIITPLLETGWERQRLWSADFYFMDSEYRKVGITRKRVDDLLSSIGEQFSKQLDEMLDYYQINVMLIEGSWSRMNPTQQLISGRGVAYHTWDMVWNWIHRWLAKGFILELTVNEEHTVQRLNALYALYQKGYSLSARSRHWADDRILSLPSGTRGKTGQKVIDSLGSIRKVANAEVSTLLSIDGIGDKKAQAIYNHMRKGE